MAFDIIGAKKAGFSDEDIAREMAARYKFDYDGAKSSGFTDSQILGEMASKSGVGTTPTGTLAAKENNGYIARVGQDWADRVKATGEMIGRNAGSVAEGIWRAPKIAALAARQVAGAINDVALEGMTSAYNTLAPDSVKNALSAGVDYAANMPWVKNALAAVGKFAGDNPDAAMAVEGLVDIPMAIPLAKGGAGILKGIGRGTVSVGKHALGATTMQGPENIATAFKSGVNGVDSFMKNLAGKVPKEEVVAKAKGILGDMRQSFSDAYREGIAKTAAIDTRIPFDSIDQAMADVEASLKHKGHWKVAEDERNILDKVAEVVDEWRQDPNVHNPIGMDALKQRIDAIYPDNQMHTQAQRAITTVRNSVKDAIVNASPEYSATMKGYEEALDLERELVKAFSLNNKASIDTALRKLQSLSRNNVNANYGYRVDLAKQLDVAGGGELIPAIAGQSMNTWLPRGLAGQGETLLTGASALHNPAALSLLPLQSPKAVGATLYGAGRVVGKVGNMAEAISSGAKGSINSILTKFDTPRTRALLEKMLPQKEAATIVEDIAPKINLDQPAFRRTGKRLDLSERSPWAPPEGPAAKYADAYEELFRIAQSPEGKRLLVERLARDEKHSKILDQILNIPTTKALPLNRDFIMRAPEEVYATYSPEFAATVPNRLSLPPGQGFTLVSEEAYNNAIAEAAKNQKVMNALGMKNIPNVERGSITTSEVRRRNALLRGLSKDNR